MSNRLLRLREAIKRTGLARSSVYLAIKQGVFPKQLKLTMLSTAGLESGVEQWIVKRVELRRGQETT
jgi:prophage regulatory protein